MILVAGNVNETVVVPVVGSAFVGSVESGGRFCVCAFWQEFGFSRHEDFLNFLQRDFINVLSVRFANINAVINCIGVQHNNHPSLSSRLIVS
jgi:hypothetical protein